MGVEIGGIDARRRPIVRIATPDSDVGFLVLLDTGFNGELLCNIDVARGLGVRPQSVVTKVELAGGVQHDVQIGSLQIIWLGVPRRVRVLVAATANMTRSPTDGEPVALLGTDLL